MQPVVGQMLWGVPVNFQTPPVETGVILDDTRHRLACCLVRDAKVWIFLNAVPKDWPLEAITLASIHELTHLNLADAGEDYRSEAYARYAEKAIYGWLHGQLEYEVLLDQILQQGQEE